MFKKFSDKIFSLLHLNVRNLNQNFESLKKLLNTIKFELKVICLTETWCTDDPINETLFKDTINPLQRGREGGRGMRDLHLPESRSWICQILVYRTSKMKNTVTGKIADWM